MAETQEPQQHEFVVPQEAAGQRLDHFVASQMEGVSRSRVQLLLEQGDVLVNGAREKASLKLRGGERIVITGEPHPAPLKAVPEAIPLDVVYEDKDMAVINNRIDRPRNLLLSPSLGVSSGTTITGVLSHISPRLDAEN